MMHSFQCPTCWKEINVSPGAYAHAFDVEWTPQTCPQCSEKLLVDVTRDLVVKESVHRSRNEKRI